MKELINVHCHVLNYRFIPDPFFRTRSPIREWLLRCKLTWWFARIVFSIWPGKRYDKYHEALAMMDQDIHAVTEELVSEMKEAGIAMATPLMMDLEFASFNVKPETPYRYQVMLISEIAGKRPGQIMPFIMFDPRRRGGSELIRTALEKMGFLGVKMYPPLGYHPDPSSFFNDAEMNRQLRDIYEYCERESIPITTHCSRGGAYSGDLMRCKELVRRFCQPSSWKGVLDKYPKLYLNFAHFGGNEDFLDIDHQESWSHTIREFMRVYGHVYADVSYHEPALWEKTSAHYFDVLQRLMKDPVVKNRIVFGTDWLMTRHTWNESDYVDAFRALPAASLRQIAFENPLRFLFPGQKLPPRIKRFFESKNIEEDQLPEWMRTNLQIQG